MSGRTYFAQRPGSTSVLSRRLKRAFDVVTSAAALACALPLIGAAAAAIALEDGLPVFYRQDRAGVGGRVFRTVKLRSMRVNDVPPDVVGQVRAGHNMVTRVGAVIRRLKIDELPQLWNVLRGEMSLVGPRPTIPRQVGEYSAFQRRRLEVLPGLTGWAQIHGNTELSWPERILLDVWYVDHWSFALDARILLSTVSVVLRGERRDPIVLAEAKDHAKRLGWSG